MCRRRAALQEFARELGAEWAGSSDRAPPEELNGAIVFASVANLTRAGRFRGVAVLTVAGSGS